MQKVNAEGKIKALYTLPLSLLLRGEEVERWRREQWV